MEFVKKISRLFYACVYENLWRIIIKAPDIFLSLTIYIITTALFIFLTSG